MVESKVSPRIFVFGGMGGNGKCLQFVLIPTSIIWMISLEFKFGGGGVREARKVNIETNQCNDNDKTTTTGHIISFINTPGKLHHLQ